METLLRIGLSNAVAAVLLALLVLAVARVCRRPALLHGLWMLVLLKLLTPPLFTIPVCWPARAEQPTPSVDPSSPEDPPPPVAEVAPQEVPPLPVEVGPALDLKPPPVPEPFPAVAAERPLPALVPAAPPAVEVEEGRLFSFSWLHLLAAFWLFGSCGWFGLALIRLRRFQRLLRHARPASKELAAEVGRWAKELGMKQSPGTFLVPGRLAPMLWTGLGKPRLLLPAGLLECIPEDQFATLLLHELAHLKRGDHWVRLLELVVRGLYWWHPLVWYACRELREAEEQCCDAWVVSTLPESGRTYATALVETLDFLSEARPPVPLLASGIGHVSDLKRRLSMIMCGTTPRALTWRGCLTVLALGGFLLPVLPTWAQPAPEAVPVKEEQPDPAKKEEVGKLKEELKKLEDVLHKKQEEMREAQRKLAAIQEKLKAAQGGKDYFYEFRIMPVPGKLVAPREITLRLVDGKWIVVSPSGPEKPIIIKARVPETVPAPPQPPATTPRFAPDFPPGALPREADAERRLEHLEKKLKDLEEMIRELKTKRPGSEESRLFPQKNWGNVKSPWKEVLVKAEDVFLQGRYSEAHKLYQEISRINPDPRTHIHALAGMLRCDVALNQTDNIHQTVKSLMDAVQKLDQPERKEWHEWLEKVSQLLRS